MNLREPKKKRNVKLKVQSPFPITFGEENDWETYTAYLTDTGSCIIQSNEINAVHSMGFFGKGSLSRAYPSFGKSRYGAPPMVRNRQWVRREEWLKQYNEISADIDEIKHLNLESSKDPQPQPCGSGTQVVKETSQTLSETEPIKVTLDIIEIDTNHTPCKETQGKEQSVEKDLEIDQIILDSNEEDDVCIIISENNGNQSEKKAKCTEQNMPEEKEDIYSIENYDFNKKNMCSSDNNTNIEGKLLVLPDSDSDTEDYIKKIKPKIKSEGFPVGETLHLTFEETFFLSYGLGCLNVINFDGTLLDINSTWHYFCKVDKKFIQKYVVYHYFRSKGWIVKPGIKYGGDFLLYKQGPPFYHASYIVIVDVIDADSLMRDANKSTRNLTWNNLLGLERLSETAAKEILFAQVLWPSSISQTVNPPNPDILSEFSVRELLWRRWNPKHDKDIVDLDQENDDLW